MKNMTFIKHTKRDVRTTRNFQTMPYIILKMSRFYISHFSQLNVYVHSDMKTRQIPTVFIFVFRMFSYLFSKLSQIFLFICVFRIVFRIIFKYQSLLRWKTSSEQNRNTVKTQCTQWTRRWTQWTRRWTRWTPWTRLRGAVNTRFGLPGVFQEVTWRWTENGEHNCTCGRVEDH